MNLRKLLRRARKNVGAAVADAFDETPRPRNQPDDPGVEVKMNDKVEAPVKSAWTSKVNVTQAVAFFAMLVTMFGIDVPEDVKAAIVAGIVAIGTVVTWALRTWFTRSLTKSSAERM